MLAALAAPSTASAYRDGLRRSTADTTPPTVTITYPPGGSWVHGTIQVTADASDDVAVDHVTFQYFDGATFHDLGTDSTAPYSVPFDSTAFPNIPFNAGTIYAQAFDTSSNPSTKYGVGIGIDNVAPVAFLNGLHASAVLGGSVVLSGSQTDGVVPPGSDIGTWAFESSPRGAGTWSIIASGTGGNSETRTWDTTTVANGAYDLRLKATDNAGNVGISGPIDVQVDNSDPDSVLKVDAGTFPSLDPANSGGQGWQILQATCAKLVNYPDTDGQAGLSNLQPEVATAMPTVSADGKTYTFTLGSNWGFGGSPESVTPQSFIRALERDLAPGGAGQGLFNDIQGAQAYINGTSPTIAGLSATGNQLTIVLNNPDKTFLAKLATPFGCAVPTSAPLMQVDDMTSAGPYWIASYVPGSQLILDVNPRYPGPRPHAFSQIVFTLGKSQAGAEADVIAGQSDYAMVGVPSSDFSTLNASYGPGATPQRFFTTPSLLERSIGFNTSHPIFASTAVRRAVAVALDRVGLAAAYPGASVTDQLLPPGLPGFQDYNIYPTNITDFSAARAAVDAAGFGNALVVVYVSQCGGTACNQIANAITTSLARVDLRAGIQIFSTAEFFSRIGNPGEPWDLATLAWAADYPDPFDFLNVLLDPNALGNFDFTQFNDPAAESLLRSDANLDPPGRYAQYSQADLSISRDFAPMTGFATGNFHDFFTARIGCQASNPFIGIDLAALCIAAQFTTSVSLSEDSSSVPAGGAKVPISNIPASAVRGVQSSPASAPIGGIPIGGIPIGGIPIGGIPIGGIPIGGIGLTAANLTQNALGGLPLNELPLNGKRWEDRLAGTLLANVPIQTLTLAQVLQSAPSALSGLTLADVDLAASPIGGIPIGGILLGGFPIGGIPIRGHTDLVTNLADWCAIINAQPGYSCPSGGSLSGQTVMGIALQGIPIGGIGLDAVPIGGIDLSGTPIGGIPIGGIDLHGTPIGGIPIGGIDLSVSPIGGIPIGGIPVANRSLVLDCSGAYTCPLTDTLAQAAAAGGIKSTATLADLGVYGSATFATIVKGLPSNFTLGQLFATLLAVTPTDWEALPVTKFPLVDFATEGGVVTYTAPFSLNGTGTTPQTVTLTATLTNGERYMAGSSDVNGTAIGDPTATSSGGVETVRWTVPNVIINSSYTLHFKTHSGLTLGSEQAQISLTVGASEPAASSPVATSIGDTNEPNDISNPHPVTTGSLYFSYITSATDKDYYSIPIPPAGTQTRILLSHLPADYDLVVFGPATLPLRTSPSDTIPLDAVSVGDTKQTLQERAQDLTPETLADVPTTPPPGDVVVGASDVRGTGDEEVDLVSTGQSGNYIIQVTGFNGAFSPNSYMLRVENESAIPLPACVPRSMGSAGTAGSMPSIPAGVNTLFLINEKQFGDLNGAPAETSVVSALNSLAGRSDLGVIGAVIPVESSVNVPSAYSTWNADPCSPAKANDIVRAIGSVIDTIRTGHPGIKNVVLVGGDDEIPMARVVDPTTQVNEVGYASTFGFAKNNEFVSSFADHMLMTDNPYGTTNPVTSLGQQQYIPSWGVGRLVDTSTDITNEINQFIASKGLLNPKTELTTAYSFLSDGGQAVANAFHNQGKTGTDLIAGPPPAYQWTRSDLVSAMFPSTGMPPAFMSINAHYDHSRLLPADQSAANRQDELYTAAMLATQGPSALQGRFWMTMGCHSGVNTPDTLFGSGNAIAKDWAQTVLEGGAVGFMGNTGYGLGDTVTVAYSEALNVDLARNLDGTLPIGQALSFAKQQYFGAAAALTDYDTKVLNEATLYGLPMWKVGTGTPAAPPPPPPTFTDPSTGLAAAEFSSSPTFTPVDTPFGRYYTINGEFSAVNRRPIEPVTSFDVTEQNLVPHGAEITALQSTDESIDPAFSRAVDDTTLPELVGQIVFPTQLQQLRSIATPNGQRQRLLLTLGQYRSDATPDLQGVGTQRKFASATVRVLYAPSSVTDFTPPSIGVVSLARIGGNVAFSATVTDPTSAIARVFALYLDGNTWRSTDLAQSAGVWSGAGPISSTSVQYYIQAVDVNGNVAVTQDKGLIESVVTPPPPTGSVRASISGSTSGDWFIGPVTVTLTGGPGVAIQDSVDGSAFNSYSSAFTVSGDGVHKVLFTGDDNSKGEVDFSIDSSGPKISIGDRSYLLGSTGNTFDFTCSDAGSGIASCTPTPSTPDTSSAGAKSFSVHAVDRVGNTADATGTYHVFWPFKGVLQPLSNIPFFNVVSAGSGVPVKFSLSGNRGLSILASGYPTSKQIACDSVAPLDTTIPTVTAGSSSLSYDSSTDTYSYVWKTDKSWLGTCRQLDIGLADGSHHVANFKFN